MEPLGHALFKKITSFLGRVYVSINQHSTGNFDHIKFKMFKFYGGGGGVVMLLAF
jgi:hypothetical protein